MDTANEIANRQPDEEVVVQPTTTTEQDNSLEPIRAEITKLRQELEQARAENENLRSEIASFNAILTSDSEPEVQTDVMDFEEVK